jgi:hypothetical protein
MTASLGYTPSELDERGAEHTAREIFQQPELWREVGRTVISRREETESFLGALLELPDLRIVLTGAGTSAPPPPPRLTSSPTLARRSPRTGRLSWSPSPAPATAPRASQPQSSQTSASPRSTTWSSRATPLASSSGATPALRPPWCFSCQREPTTRASP